jgi:hypothetical protein
MRRIAAAWRFGSYLIRASAFASLLGKVLPTTLAGDPANPIVHESNVDLSVYSNADLHEMRRILSKGPRQP